mgnify:CR=1 FL=1
MASLNNVVGGASEWPAREAPAQANETIIYKIFPPENTHDLLRKFL